MKTFFRSLKRQDGFTLVELMVVVAIIGLLSAVAIPNFRKYQAKAKMSEAKLQLSSVYTAETAFFSDFNIYHNCIAYMGYNPQREVMNRYYAVGFAVTAAINGAAYTAAQNSGLDPLQCPSTNGTSGAMGTTATTVVPPTQTWFNAGKGVGSQVASATTYMPTTLLGAQDTQANMTFTAGAGGVIDGDNTTPGPIGTGNNSQLTINEQKVMQVARNGY